MAASASTRLANSGGVLIGQLLESRPAAARDIYLLIAMLSRKPAKRCGHVQDGVQLTPARLESGRTQFRDFKFCDQLPARAVGQQLFSCQRHRASLSRRFRILPVALLGNSLTKATDSGAL